MDRILRKGLMAAAAAGVLTTAQAADGNPDASQPPPIAVSQTDSPRKHNVVVARVTMETCGTPMIPGKGRAEFGWVSAATPDDKGTVIASLTARGNEMLRKDGYDTDPNSTGFIGRQMFSVKDIIGTPETIRPLIPIGNYQAAFPKSLIESFPPGATKVLLLKAHNSVYPYRMPSGLAVAYDDISDQELREIAFDEAVSRIFCWAQ